MAVLVAVSSRHGATAELAEVVAEVLTERGHQAAVVDPEEVTTVDPYRAAVLGSSVYAGRMGPGLHALVDRFGGQLAALPVWLFTSGPLSAGMGPEVGDPMDLDSLRNRVRPREYRSFAGKLDRGDLSMAERALAALVRAKPGDYRDFDAVARWAGTIADELDRP